MLLTESQLDDLAAKTLPRFAPNWMSCDEWKRILKEIDREAQQIRSNSYSPLFT